MIPCDLCPAPAEVRFWAYIHPGQTETVRCYEHRLVDGHHRRRTYMGSNLGQRFDQAMMSSDLIPPPGDVVAVGLRWGGNPIETRIPLVEATPARVACEVQSLRKHAVWSHEAHRGQLVGRESLSVCVRTSYAGYSSFAPGSTYTPGRPAYVPKRGVLISVGEDALRMWGAVRRMHDLNNHPLPEAA